MNFELVALLPIIIPALAAVMVFIQAAFLPSRVLSLFITVVSLVLGGYFSLAWIEPMTVFSGMLQLDRFAQMGAISCFGLSIIAVFAAPSYFKRLGLDFVEEYHGLLLAAVAGMIVMVAANDLVVIFVNLELASLATYIMCGLNRHNRKSVEAALKYFVTGAAASAFMIFGMALIYGVTGSTDLEVIGHLMGGEGGWGATTFSSLALLFLLVGFFFKLGLAPFHAWIPDVYQGAPTPVTGFMAAALRLGVTIVLIKLCVVILQPAMPDFTKIIWWLAVISMTIGNLCALRQDNVKRMMAYSSIAHAGYMAVGFLGVSDQSAIGVQGVFYYAVSYSLMTVGFFMFIGQVEGVKERYLTVRDYRGLGMHQPLVGLLATVLLLSMIGIPPLAGFWAKFAVFSAALREGFVGLVVFAALNSVISAYYYLRLLVSLYMQETDRREDLGAVAYCRSSLVTGALAVCVFLTIWLGISPLSFALLPSADGFWSMIEMAVAVLR